MRFASCHGNLHLLGESPRPAAELLLRGGLPQRLGQGWIAADAAAAAAAPICCCCCCSHVAGCCMLCCCVLGCAAAAAWHVAGRLLVQARPAAAAGGLARCCCSCTRGTGRAQLSPLLMLLLRLRHSCSADTGAVPARLPVPNCSSSGAAAATLQDKLFIEHVAHLWKSQQASIK
jgi:hypothetical protein